MIQPDDHEAPGSAREVLAGIVREEHGALVGGLVRRFGDVDVAEEALADACAEATTHWDEHGIPANPAGWLALTARRKGLDRVRRESSRQTRESEGMRMLTTEELPLGVVDDDRLRLLFMCCHPALAPDVRVALTLRLVTGLAMDEIAAAFLVEERTLAQRLTRAKRKIRDAHISFRIPEADDIAERLGGVLDAIQLTWNEGYLSRGAGQPVRDDLSLEAIRLARMLRRLVPGHPEATALLALLLLGQARRPARVAAGELVLLADQDRGRWDAALLTEGLTLSRREPVPSPSRCGAARPMGHNGGRE